MKKMCVAAAMAAMLMFSACGGGGNTPTKVAEQAAKCMQDKDYEGFVDLMYVENEEGKDLESEKKMVAGMLQAKAESSLNEKQGIQSYEVTSEEISEDGETAKVGMKLVYANGEEDDETMKLRKDADGNWKLDIGK